MSNETIHPNSLVSQKPVPETPQPGKWSLTRRGLMGAIYKIGTVATLAVVAGETLKYHGANEAVADMYNAAQDMTPVGVFCPEVADSSSQLLGRNNVDETDPKWEEWSRINKKEDKVLSDDGKVLFDGQQFLPGQVFTPTAAALSEDGLLLRVNYTVRPSVSTDGGKADLRDKQPEQLNAATTEGVLIVVRPKSADEKLKFLRFDSGESVYFVEAGVVTLQADKVIMWENATKAYPEKFSSDRPTLLLKKTLRKLPNLTDFAADIELRRQILTESGIEAPDGGKLGDMFWDQYSNSKFKLDEPSFATPNGSHLAIGADEKRATKPDASINLSGKIVQLDTVILLPLTGNIEGYDFKRVTPYDFTDLETDAKLSPISPIGVFDNKFLIQLQSYAYTDGEDPKRYLVTQQIGIFDPSGKADGFITAPENAYNLIQTEDGLEITSGESTYLFSNNQITDVISEVIPKDETRSKWVLKAE